MSQFYSGIAKGSCNERGECTCDIGFAGASCEIECPNRCSSHGRCDRNMAANTEASYHCFCESPWTGKACDQTSHSNVVRAILCSLKEEYFVSSLFPTLLILSIVFCPPIYIWDSDVFFFFFCGYFFELFVVVCFF